MRRPGGRVYSYLAAEVLEREPPGIQELLRIVASLGRFTPELLRALGVSDAPQAVASLARRGLFLELHRAEAEWYSPTQLLRSFLLAHPPLARDAHEDLHRRASAWLEEHGYLEEALRLLREIEDHEAVARLLTDRGRALLRMGAPEAVIDAASDVPAPLRTPALDELEGECASDPRRLGGRARQLRAPYGRRRPAPSGACLAHGRDPPLPRPSRRGARALPTWT